MITREEAISIARARAKARGWGLREPLGITERRDWSGKLRSYQVVSDLLSRGTKTRFTIDAGSGAILDEGHVPR